MFFMEKYPIIENCHNLLYVLFIYLFYNFFDVYFKKRLVVHIICCFLLYKNIDWCASAHNINGERESSFKINIW
jgi:hypothetical protein